MPSTLRRRGIARLRVQSAARTPPAAGASFLNERRVERSERQLEPRSRRPHRLRRPSYTGALVRAVERLRAEHPMWGKGKIAVLLRRDLRYCAGPSVTRRRALMAIKKDTLDQLLDGRDPKEVFNKDGLFAELKKAHAERVLNAELDDHLESEAPAGRRNHRNGHSKKTVLTETAKLDIRIPRDREGTFDPKLMARISAASPASTRRSCRCMRAA